MRRNSAAREREPLDLAENPSRMTPIPEFFYSNPEYEKACATVVGGIRERKGLILLTGEPGTGKTTVVQQAIARLDQSAYSVLFCSFHPALDETLNSLCQHLGLAIDRHATEAKTELLKQALLARSRDGSTVGFVIDDAHTLDEHILGQLLSLADPRPTGTHLLQIVLVGLPEIFAKLQSPQCRPFLPESFPRTEVGTLPLAEVGSFIEQRLRATHGEPRYTFSQEAIERIAAYSKGIPREINALCGLAAVIANLESSSTITAEMVEEIKGERALWAVGANVDALPPTTLNTAVSNRAPAAESTPTARNRRDDLLIARLEFADKGPSAALLRERSADVRQLSPVELSQPTGDASDSKASTQPEFHFASERRRWSPLRIAGTALAVSILFATVAVLWKQSWHFASPEPLATAFDRSAGSMTTPSTATTPPPGLETQPEFAQMAPSLSLEPEPQSMPPGQPLSEISPPSSPQNQSTAAPPAAEPSLGARSEVASLPEQSTLEPTEGIPPTVENEVGERSQGVAPIASSTAGSDSPTKPGEPRQAPSSSATEKRAVALAKPTMSPQGEAVPAITPATIQPGVETAKRAENRSAGARGRSEKQQSALISTRLHQTTGRSSSKGEVAIPAAKEAAGPASAPTADQAKTDGVPRPLAEEIIAEPPKPIDESPTTTARLDDRKARDTTTETPLGSNKVAPLPAILGSVDASGYQSMENGIMDQVTAQMLPIDPKQIDLTGFRSYLAEGRQPGVESGLSGPATSLGLPSFTIDAGTLSTFSGR